MTEFLRPPGDREKCRGCGHRLSRHTRYADGGKNRHGATIVCVVDNCHWTECREPRGSESLATPSAIGRLEDRAARLRKEQG